MQKSIEFWRELDPADVLWDTQTEKALKTLQAAKEDILALHKAVEVLLGVHEDAEYMTNRERMDAAREVLDD